MPTATLSTRPCASCSAPLPHGSIRCGSCSVVVDALLICNSCEAGAMAPGQDRPGQLGYCPECLSEVISLTENGPDDLPAALCPRCGEGTYVPNNTSLVVHVRTASIPCPVLEGLDPIPGPCSDCQGGDHDHPLVGCGCRKQGHPSTWPWLPAALAISLPVWWCPCGRKWDAHPTPACPVAERPAWATAWATHSGS